MMDAVVSVLPVWGLALIAVFNGVGRCGVPLPSSVLMITYGALVVADLRHLGGAIAVAYGAALIGDLLAYRLGRQGRGVVDRLAARSAKLHGLVEQAKGLAARWGAFAVLVTRWPLSTLGPYVNLVAGAIRMPFGPYAICCLVGELVWVSLYVTLGYAFSANLDRVIAQTGRGSLLLGAVVLAALALWMRKRHLPRGG